MYRPSHALTVACTEGRMYRRSQIQCSSNREFPYLSKLSLRGIASAVCRECGMSSVRDVVSAGYRKYGVS
jgi:hypothetical protein